MRSTRGSALAPCSSKAVLDGARQRFRDPPPASHAALLNPSVSYVISDQWDDSFSVPITRRWFETVGGVGSNDLTLEPLGVIECIIPGNWLGGARSAQIFGNPAVDGLVLYERNWSAVSSFEYGQWLAGIVPSAEWCF